MVSTPAPSTNDVNAAMKVVLDAANTGGSYTVGSSSNMNVVALSDANYEMNFMTNTMTSVLNGETFHMVGFNTQVNYQTALAGTNIIQSWWSANIGSDATNTKVNMICQYNNAAGGSTSRDIRSSANAPVNTGNANAIFVGTLLNQSDTVLNFVAKLSVEASDSASAGWSNFACANSLRADYAYTGLNNLKIGDSIAFTAGFRLKGSATKVPNLQEGTSSEMSMTIMDSAMALAVSATTAFAVASLSF